MILSEMIDEMLERDGLVGINSSGTTRDDLVGRVTACATSAVSRLVKELADATPGMAFELDVDVEYDAQAHQVEIESTVSVLHPDGGTTADVSLVLLSHGFDYLAEHDMFRVFMTIALRRA